MILVLSQSPGKYQNWILKVMGSVFTTMCFVHSAKFLFVTEFNDKFLQ